nr:hypothetical protein [Tanacetum cinerariifolium]
VDPQSNTPLTHIPLRAILGVLQIAAFKALPSPDYVPGPEEPNQAPPSPVYIPYVSEPVYLEYIPPEDDVFPAEEQPLPAAALPTAEPQPPTLSFTKEDAERFLAMPIPPSSSLTPLSSPLPQIPSPPLLASPPSSPYHYLLHHHPYSYYLLTVEQIDPRQMEIFQRVEALVDDSQYHYETGRLVDQEARRSRGAWAYFIGLSSAVHFELQGYMTHTWVQDQRIDAHDTLIATLTTQLSLLQGHLATALGEI